MASGERLNMAYVKEAFNPITLEDAMHVVLTSDPENPSKFVDETNKLIHVILDAGIITSDSVVLDFGCGMGRISKELVDRVGCTVHGLDQSQVMLDHAITYVNSDKFKPCTEFPDNKIDVAISILVLQHTEDPIKEISSIYDSLTDGGYFILVNESYRLIPVDINDDGWVIWSDDGINIYAEVANKFTEVARSNKAGGLDVILFMKDSQ